MAIERELGAGADERFDSARELLSRIVGIDRRDDATRLWQLGEDATDSLDLMGARGPRGADETSGGLRRRVKLEVAQRVDGAFGDDERAVAGESGALPRALGPARREASEASILDLEAGHLAGVGRVNEQRIASGVDSPGLCKPRMTKRLGANAAGVEIRAIVRASGRRKGTRHGLRVTRRGDRGRGPAIEVGTGRAEPVAELLAQVSEGGVSASMLDKVDDGAAIAIVSNREIGPMAIGGPSHDDLVVRARVAQHMAGAAALSAIALVSVTLHGELDQVNFAFESVKLGIVHGGLQREGLRGEVGASRPSLRPRRSACFGWIRFGWTRLLRVDWAHGRALQRNEACRWTGRRMAEKANKEKKQATE